MIHREVVREALRRHAKTYGPELPVPEPLINYLESLAEWGAPRIWGLLKDNVARGWVELELLVIAHALGWNRDKALVERLDGSPWDRVWEPAMAWLTREVYTAMERVSNYLEYGLHVRGYAFVSPHPELQEPVRGLAGDMARKLVNGSCECAKLCLAQAARTTTPQEPEECKAGLANFNRRLARCNAQHAIERWEVERCSFRAFIRQAIKGVRLRESRILPGGLVQGMHFANLFYLIGLRFGDVLVWVCQCGAINFEGLPCLECGKPCDPEARRTVTRRLLIEQVNGGRYVADNFWNCQVCRTLAPVDDVRPLGHYYPGEAEVCPRCNHRRTRGAKLSRVYVLAPLQGAPEEASAGSGSPDSGPSEAVEPAEESDLARLRWALQKLPKTQQKLMRLMFKEGLELQEAAARLGLEIKEAAALHEAAMAALKELLKAGEETGEEDDEY